MTKRMGSSIALISLLLVVTMCLFVCSCKKAPEPTTPTETQALAVTDANQQAQLDAAVKQLEESAKEAEAAAEKKVEAAAAEAAAAAEKVQVPAVNVPAVPTAPK